MILLDENVPEGQRRLLQSWRIHVRQLGSDLEHQGLRDEQIIVLLRRLRRVTFFTLDSDFYKPNLCHANYCLVILIVGQYETATFVRRFLRHPAFDTQVKRLGTVVRLSPTGVRSWRLHSNQEEELAWPVET